MVFGYKRKPLTGYYLPELLKTELPPGDKASYCRPIPPANAITNEEYIDSPKSYKCGGKFSSVSTHNCYVEDVLLPELTESYQVHLVNK